jgi:hypothetical protein
MWGLLFGDRPVCYTVDRWFPSIYRCDVEHAWGEGGHDSDHAAAIIPDALRWLWRGYPDPVTEGPAAKRRTDVLIPGGDWHLLSQGHSFTEGPAVNEHGEVFFTDIPSSRIYRIGLDDKVIRFAEDSGKAVTVASGASVASTEQLVLATERVREQAHTCRRSVS